MLSYKLDFGSCACRLGFVKSSHIAIMFKFQQNYLSFYTVVRQMMYIVGF